MGNFVLMLTSRGATSGILTLLFLNQVLNIAPILKSPSLQLQQVIKIKAKTNRKTVRRTEYYTTTTKEKNI